MEIISFGCLKFIEEEIRLRWKSYKLQRSRTDMHKKMYIVCAQDKSTTANSQSTYSTEKSTNSM